MDRTTTRVKLQFGTCKLMCRDDAERAEHGSLVTVEFALEVLRASKNDTPVLRAAGHTPFERQPEPSQSRNARRRRRKRKAAAAQKTQFKGWPKFKCALEVLNPKCIPCPDKLPEVAPYPGCYSEMIRGRRMYKKVTEVSECVGCQRPWCTSDCACRHMPARFKCLCSPLLCEECASTRNAVPCECGNPDCDKEFTKCPTCRSLFRLV